MLRGQLFVGETMDNLIWVAIAVFIFAGIIKGTIGIGLPTASISVLSQFYDPHTAIALVIFPMMISNFWQLIRSGDFVRVLTTFWPFGLTLMFFIAIFTNLSAVISVEIIMIILGVVIIFFVISSLFIRPAKLPERFDKIIQVIAGGLAGIMGGLTAIWSPPMVIYLVSRRVEKDDFIRATGLLVTMGSLPLCVGYWMNGLMTGPLASISLMLIIPTLIGFNLGERLRRKIEPVIFQKIVLSVFLLMGLNIIRQAVF